MHVLFHCVASSLSLLCVGLSSVAAAWQKCCRHAAHACVFVVLGLRMPPQSPPAGSLGVYSSTCAVLGLGVGLVVAAAAAAIVSVVFASSDGAGGLASALVPPTSQRGCCYCSTPRTTGAQQHSLQPLVLAVLLPSSCIVVGVVTVAAATPWQACFNARGVRRAGGVMHSQECT